MRFLVLFSICSPLFLLSSCMLKEDPETTRRTQELQQEIATLKIENANLKVENDLYKAWWMPQTIQKNIAPWIETTDPQFVEWSFASCMQEAHQMFIAQGSAYCNKAGYIPVDIAANKCQLVDSVIEKLKKIKSQAEWECYNLYQ